MSQIFGWKEYDPGHEIVRRLRALAVAWVSEGILPVIVDGGANVGYSSIFFAAMIPEATILAIEPDPETCQRLSRNCQGWLTIKPKRGALWEHENGINLKDGGHGSWSNYVDRDGTFTPSFTLSGLLEEEGNCRLLVLKLDVEGAERAIAAASAEAVRSSACIMIEPHDFLRPGLACMQPLFQAIANIPFDTLICGENLIFLSPELMEVELQHR